MRKIKMNSHIKCGHWIQVDKTKCRCSNCDIVALIALYPHGDKNYCPNCGCKMNSNRAVVKVIKTKVIK